MEITTYYTAAAKTKIDLPKGYTSKDIWDISIRWDGGVVEFNDGTELNFELGGADIDCVDWKRPTGIESWDGEDIEVWS